MMELEDEHEAHIPAEHPPPEAQARLPFADAYPCRSRDHPPPPRQGPEDTHGLTTVESLASSQRIRAVRSARQRAAGATMVVHALDRDDDETEARVAVVAGKAVGNAVRRNRAKRRLRAAARQARLPAVDLVVDARRSAIDVPFDRLPRDLERLLATARTRVRR
jgi:ribonuclease P protein component